MKSPGYVLDIQLGLNIFPICRKKDGKKGEETVKQKKTSKREVKQETKKVVKPEEPAVVEDEIEEEVEFFILTS